MRNPWIVPLLAAVVTAAATPSAQAKDFVQDQGGMLSAPTIASLNSRIGSFNAQTGKEIVVLTVPSVPGADVASAAQSAFTQQQVNGVLLFIDKGDRRDYLLPDQAAMQAGWWTSETSQSILTAMQAQFRAGDYDGGVTTAVNGIFDVYRSHLQSLNSNSGYARQPVTAQTGASGISSFWWIVMGLVAFFVIRSVMRAATVARYYGSPAAALPPGQTPAASGTAPPAATSAAAPAPAPGYGYGGYGWGGGGFLSGLLGGLGGAWLGNELFRGGGGFGGIGGGIAGSGSAPDAGGWQADPGQAGIGGGAGGDWGGGGFGGGGFGGGFGGGDFGGGAGGGW